ncbi:hypothetical protein BU23DRAFT_565953 [Bimuria novae-zelandiae CBS 107.79]|uniref:Uncharacterized protein n=1 Tax=Bimuria novae-zelandiae CBS 107.79 TaxID=1447943 RepID=A0A6A5VKM5_9PLEO|nr:hypothetical protein BU23DRAFT_565953 [Bimuria novae-zelandiae CBS 107.79]
MAPDVQHYDPWAPGYVPPGPDLSQADDPDYPFNNPLSAPVRDDQGTTEPSANNHPVENEDPSRILSDALKRMFDCMTLCDDTSSGPERVVQNVQVNTYHNHGAVPSIHTDNAGESHLEIGNNDTNNCNKTSDSTQVNEGHDSGKETPTPGYQDTPTLGPQDTPAPDTYHRWMPPVPEYRNVCGVGNSRDHRSTCPFVHTGQIKPYWKIIGHLPFDTRGGKDEMIPRTDWQHFGSISTTMILDLLVFGEGTVAASIRVYVLASLTVNAHSYMEDANKAAIT